MQSILLDRFDLQLLEAIQQDAELTQARLGERIPLSASQISRRLQRLMESGLVSGVVALLKPAELGLDVLAFAEIVLKHHGLSESESFESAVSLIPEVMECFSVSGDADYFLRIIAPDLAAFSSLMMKQILRLPGVAHVKTNIVLHEIKATHVLPLDHIAAPARPKRSIRYAAR